MSRPCLTPGCQRARRAPGADGTLHAHCDACEARLLREAWGPVSWHDRAAAGELPALVVGGVPTSDPTEGTRGQKPTGVPAIQRADALAGGSSAGDSAGSERVIARATSGPAVLRSAPAPDAASPRGVRRSGRPLRARA